MTEAPAAGRAAGRTAGSGRCGCAGSRPALPPVPRQRPGTARIGRDARLGRYSFLTADPAIVVRSKGAHDRGAAGRHLAPRPRRCARRRSRAAGAARDRAGAGLPPFQGGAAGYIGYDWARCSSAFRPPATTISRCRTWCSASTTGCIAWDHEAVAAWLISTGLPGCGSERARRARGAAGDGARAAVRGAAGRRSRRDRTRSPARPDRRRPRCRRAVAIRSPADGRRRRLGLRSSFTHRGYLDAVARVREYISPATSSRPTCRSASRRRFAEPPWELYRRLRRRNPAPFAAYLDFDDVRS